MNKFWKYIPAGLAHELAPIGLSFYSEFINQCYNRDFSALYNWRNFQWKNLNFRNPIGIAGGVDKNAEQISSWEILGAGFIEIGTITPRPQSPNPGKILDRDWKNKNLWNKMGFPGEGADSVKYNLEYNKSTLPIFVNVGKNRLTSNENAVLDYLECIYKLQNYADTFVINVSSPNTKDLRQLQSSNQLSLLVEKCVQASANTPVLVKFSPDMSEEAFKNSLNAALSAGASGMILTNTTTYRPNDCFFSKEGGLSGADLALKSKQVLGWAMEELGTQSNKYLIISTGGINSLSDVLERLEMGANLTQIYSALVFNGPGVLRDIAIEYSGVKDA